MVASPDHLLDPRYYPEQHEEWVKEECEMPSYVVKKEGTMANEVRVDVFEAMLALAKRAWTMPDNVRLCRVESHMRILLAPFYAGDGTGLMQEEISLGCYPMRVGPERWDCYLGYGPISNVLAWRVEGPF